MPIALFTTAGRARWRGKRKKWPHSRPICCLPTCPTSASPQRRATVCLCCILDRKDWPEAPHLVDWLKRYGRCQEVERAALEQGAIAAELEALWALPAKAPVKPEGIAQAADFLLALLC